MGTFSAGWDAQAARAAESREADLFKEHQARVWRRTDRLFAALMVFQWILGIVFAICVSPRTWEGTLSSTHIHVWAALFLGGAIMAFPVLMALKWPGTTATRHTIAAAQMLTSALLIHLTGGRIETHFHVFGSLAFLALYRDWRVLMTASGIVFTDHFLRGVFWPQSVYGVLSATMWRAFEHAGWVLFENVVLVASCRQGLREMREIAATQAGLEALNASIERQVSERTAKLRASEETLRTSEQALQDQRAFLRLVIDTAPNLIFVKDRQGRFVLVNKTVAEAYGTTVEGLVGKTDADFNSNAEEVEWFRRDDLEVMDTLGEKRIPEEMITDARGNVRWLHTVKRPLIGPDGRADQVMGVATDVTEHKRTEEALRQSQKMEALGRLAGGIAHDFNNLLSVIGGFSELLMRDLAAEDRRRGRVEQIQKAADRAAGLTRQLLAFTRKQVVQPRALDLNAAVADMDDMLRRLIGADVDLQVRLASGLRSVRADSGQMEQVLMNLCVNARDAMPGGGRLTIETADVHLDRSRGHAVPGADSRPFVLLAVTDTGVGMDAETKTHIFEPFFTTKEKGKGTGLGLATVYGIVQQSGGHISVYSEPGKGTSFKVYFPRAEGRMEAGRQSPESVPLSGGTETILLVEDEEAVRSLARELLEGGGYTVIEARTGQEGLAACRRHPGPIDLLLTDVVMPEMGGPQLAEQVTRLRPEMAVVYMSGYAEGALVHQGVVSEGIALIEKPFSHSQLAQKVRHALDERCRSERSAKERCA